VNEHASALLQDRPLGSRLSSAEGHNRAIKTVARDAYGYRNPADRRLRTRLPTTRQGRGCLETRTKHA
jgi:hypothetical protein